MAEAGRGADAAYAAWYERMLGDTATYGLPFAYWDRMNDDYGPWSPRLTHLPTTARTAVPAPPPGSAHFAWPT